MEGHAFAIFVNGKNLLSVLPVLSTTWSRVWTAYLGGCIGAFQIGKVVASLPLLIDDLSLSLAQAGWVLSLFSLIAAAAGALFGMLADRLGPARLAAIGLVIAALGSFAGATADSFAWLILTRLIEGFGFILAIVSCPSLISRSVTDRDRPLAMGLWGSFLPVGVAGSMLLTPAAIELHGWRGLWGDVGWLSIFWAILILVTFARDDRTGGPTPAFGELLAPVKKMGPLLLLIGFACYSALYQSVTALLPTMLVDDYALLLSSAASLGSFVVVANVIGNVGAGWLIGRGVAPWILLTIAFLIMGLCASLMFAAFTEPSMKIIFGLVFSACGGMFPGTAFVLAARLAATPAHVAMMAGLLLQGSGIGQTTGPLLTSAVVDASNNWSAAIPGFVSVAFIGLCCALILRRLDRRSSIDNQKNRGQ